MKSSQPISTDFTWAGEKMVREQIIGRGVSDARVIGAIRKIPRRPFIDPGLVNRADDDSAVPIAEKQALSQPYRVARMTEELGDCRFVKLLRI